MSEEYMSVYRIPGVVTGMAVLAISLSACGGDKVQDGALAQDSSLVRDLALAGQDSVEPALQDVPDTSASVVAPVAPTPTPAPAPAPRPRPRPATPSTPAPAPAPEPAPTPAPKAPEEGVVAAGTSFSFASNSKVCSGVQQVGDTFTARLDGAVSGTNGASIPAGSIGTFEIVTAKRAKNQNDNTYLTVRLISVTVGENTYPVQATTENAVTERIRSASTGTDAKKVAGGAILGAIAGQILGKDTKSTVVGAAAGAAAGTAAAVGTADFDTCINSGAIVTVQLDAPITIKV